VIGPAGRATRRLLGPFAVTCKTASTSARPFFEWPGYDATGEPALASAGGPLGARCPAGGRCRLAINAADATARELLAVAAVGLASKKGW